MLAGTDAESLLEGDIFGSEATEDTREDIGDQSHRPRHRER